MNELHPAYERILFQKNQQENDRLTMQACSCAVGQGWSADWVSWNGNLQLQTMTARKYMSEHVWEENMADGWRKKLQVWTYQWNSVKELSSETFLYPDDDNIGTSSGSIY